MGGSDSKGGSQSKRRAHTAKLVAGIAALFVLGVLASGAVADPGDPLGGAVSVFTGETGTDSTSDSTSAGSSASSGSTDTTAAATSDAASTSTDSTTTGAAPSEPPVSYIV